MQLQRQKDADDARDAVLSLGVYAGSAIAYNADIDVMIGYHELKKTS